MVTCGYDSITKHQKNMLPWQDSTKSLLPNKCRCKFPTPCWYAQKTTETNSGFPKKSHHSLGGDVGTHRFGKKKQKSLHTKMHGSVWGASVATLGNPPPQNTKLLTAVLTERQTMYPPWKWTVRTYKEAFPKGQNFIFQPRIFRWSFRYFQGG